jgi:hypothetical protein
MGRANHTHFEVGREYRDDKVGAWEIPPNPRIESREYVLFLCGHAALTENNWNRYDTNPKYVTCPACLKKLAKQALRQRPADAAKLEAVKDPDAKGNFRYQQGYKALLNGEVIAYLGYEDHHWRVYPLTIYHSEDDEVPQPYVRNARRPMNEDGGQSDYSDRWLNSRAAAFKTRDDALMACERLFAEGKLKTAERLLREHVEEQAKWAIESAARRQRRADADKARAELLEALQEVLDQHPLSNFQRMGIVAALERLTPKPAIDSQDDEAER